MSLIWLNLRQLWICRAFGFVFAYSPVRQLMAAQYPVNGSDGRQWLYSYVFHLPVNGLSAAKQIMVVEIKTNHLHYFYNFYRRKCGYANWPSRTTLTPRFIIIGVTLIPFIQPYL